MVADGRGQVGTGPGQPAMPGAGGLTTDDGVTVYPAEDLAERNATYEVARYAPGFVLIGDDSGGRGFLLRAGDPRSAVFSSDLGDLDPEGFGTEAPDFASWIAALRDAPAAGEIFPAGTDEFPRRRSSNG